MARLDKYLEKINGGQGDIPAPQSSLDKQMATLAESGGGGGGDGGVLYVTITALPDPETQELTIITSDKTYAEIDAAMTAGTPVIANMVSEGFFAPMLAQKVGVTIAFLMLGFAPMGQSSMLMAAVIAMTSNGAISMNYTSTATMTPMGG